MIGLGAAPSDATPLSPASPSVRFEIMKFVDAHRDVPPEFDVTGPR